MKKITGKTPDLTEKNKEKLQALSELFPNVVTEKEGEDGTSTRSIDFDLLKQALSDSLVEGSDERYRLDWPGKRRSLLKANTPITKTLRPVREESEEFDTTQNLFIEGDNFEALKILQESYLGKVKMIYIDPPYNTGKDFVYSDKHTMDEEEYTELTGAEDEEGNRMFRENTRTNPRFHSDWLSMMYERLVIARDLLKDDGVIFISIDDNEVHNLRKICDEVLGETNFLTSFIWNNEGNIDNQSKIKTNHEYILCYSKTIDLFAKPDVIDPNIEETSKLYNDTIENSITKNGPANPASDVVLPVGFPTVSEAIELEAQSEVYPHRKTKVTSKSFKLIAPAKMFSGWSSKNLLDLYIKNGCEPILDAEGKETWFAITDTGAIYVYKKRANNQSHVLSVLRNFGTTKQNSGMLGSWGIDFTYPKPFFLIQYLVSIASKNEIVLDFFSGSATTAHAVMKQNAEDGGNRKFIMVQLPEETPEDSEARNAGYDNIAQLGRERIRRAAAKIKEDYADKLAEREIPLDTGFRTYRVDETNMKDVFYHPTEVTQETLLDLADNIKEDRTPEDLLTQVMLDLGLTLDLPLEERDINGNKVFVVAGNALVACFDQSLNEGVVDAIAELQPLKLVVRDATFGSGADRDQKRTNLATRLKRLSPDTEITVL